MRSAILTVEGGWLARMPTGGDPVELAETSLNQRTNIGVFVDTLDQDYQQQIVLGIDAEARSLDLDVVCFAGGVLDAPEPVHQQTNAAYGLCSEQSIDAL